MKETVYDRHTLYDEVWKEPVLIVAKRYGVTDVALHKICKKLQVPVPPRGYWARLRAGEKVKRDPLPKYTGPERIISRRSEDLVQNPKSERPEILGFLDEATRAAVLEVSENLTVPEELTEPHPLVAEARKYLRSEKPFGSSPMLTPGPGILGIHVSKDSLDRALRIMDVLIKGLEALGYPTTVSERSTRVHIGTADLPIRLVERAKQVAHALTPEETGKKRSGYDWLIPRYDQLPSGELTITIESDRIPQRRWSDGKRQRIEDCLGEVVIALVQAAENERLWRIERDLREQRWREEERRRLELQIRRHEEEKRLEVLIGEAEDWRLAEMVRQYADALERKAAQNSLDADRRAKLLDVAAWAKEKADWLDPLVGRMDPLLGARNRRK